MEVSDVQIVNGKVEVTFMNEFGDDVATIIISKSDAKLIGQTAEEK